MEARTSTHADVTSYLIHENYFVLHLINSAASMAAVTTIAAGKPTKSALHFDRGGER
ncbi:MAG: hypothetical protein RLP98_08655 [Devosia sp.]